MNPIYADALRYLDQIADGDYGDVLEILQKQTVTGGPEATMHDLAGQLAAYAAILVWMSSHSGGAALVWVAARNARPSVAAAAEAAS